MHLVDLGVDPIDLPVGRLLDPIDLAVDPIELAVSLASALRVSDRFPTKPRNPTTRAVPEATKELIPRSVTANFKKPRSHLD